MRLNNKRTILLGLAFLSICAFWQMYDNVIPLILTKTFHLNETFSGAIMAADNVLALFLLPFFGSLSDRTNTRLGKRMPYIVAGTIIAVVLLCILPGFDNAYYAAPSTAKLIGFVVMLGLLLVTMGTYRSPAVALMPDVTPKPLRSKANAIINLMGAVGGILYLAVAAFMYPNSKVQGLEHVNYRPLFLVIASIMLVSIVLLLVTINEPKLSAENQTLEAEHPEWNLAEDDGSGNEVLPAPVKRSLAFLLASIAFWYIGYNGVTTWFTTYVDQIMGQGLGGASTCLLIATAGAIVSYIPIGNLAQKIGRKKTIQIGIAVLTICFVGGFFLTTSFRSINVIMFIVFALVGFAWAAINVNSLPMVVEMCRGSDIGRFTGYYYTASMAAQVITPIFAGFLMRNISYKVLFPYAAFFVACSFITMLFVKHGDAAPMMNADNDEGNKTSPGKIFAHRGLYNKPESPENSLSAFRRAVEYGFGAEFDVHLIKDGSLVVFHDDNLQRETGIDGIISEHTLEELSDLRLEGTEERIPTLDEVLGIFENSCGPDDKPYQLLIELKVEKNYKELVAAVCERLKAYQGEYIIESFDPRAIYELRKNYPNITRGQLVQDFTKHDSFPSALENRILTAMPYNFITKPDFIAFRLEDRDCKPIKRACADKGIAKAVWTIQNQQEQEMAEQLGYSIIFDSYIPDSASIAQDD